MAYSILDNLNDEQRKPAEVSAGAVLVTAGAGSGKTRMLTHHIAYLIDEIGVPAYNILAITFTNKASEEMKSRIERMVDSASDAWICTFHAMCSRILRSHAEELGYDRNFTIYGDVEQERVIKRILEGKSTSVNAETIAWHISNAKNHLLSPEDYEREMEPSFKRDAIISCYAEYEKELKKSNSFDFDDLLMKTYQLFVEKPQILELYQNRFKYIHVDEFQDTNYAQYKLIQLLAGKYHNVFVVGDEDQCIYSWRGAESGNVLAFSRDFAPVQVFKLEQNYRSTKQILSKANYLIKRNLNRLDKNLWTDNSDGARVEEYSSYNDAEEAEYVADTINNLVTYSGYSFKDFAILMRVNSLSRNIEEKLLMYNIPYKVYGGHKFFERKEIKDVVAYLRLLSNPKDDEAALRMLVFPKKGIGDVAINNILELADINGCSIMDIVMDKTKSQGVLAKKLEAVRELFEDLFAKKEAMPLYELVDYVISRVGIKEAIGKKTEEDENRVLNVEDFLLSVKEYADSNTTADLEEFLQGITLMRDIDSMNDDEDFANVMTIHSAKGLEFKVVFIIGLSEGLFPLARAINGSQNELEEERRLMYVAITRARERLYLTRSRTRFNFEKKTIEYTNPSRFLNEIDEEPTRLTTSDIKVVDYDKRNKVDYNLASKINYVNVSGSSDNFMKNNVPTSMLADVNKPKINFSAYKRGTKVHHPHFGNGVVTIEVTDFAGAFVTVDFESVGTKTLSLKYAKLEIIG